MALKALRGVGDAPLGEWEERGEKAYHVRRRLTADEEKPIGPPVDIRGTEEAMRRLRRCWPFLPDQWRGFAMNEATELATCEVPS